MTSKKTVHSFSGQLFLMLLFNVIIFMIMLTISNLLLPFQYWFRIMHSNDPVIREYFYCLLNGNL